MSPDYIKYVTFYDIYVLFGIVVEINTDKGEGEIP